LLLSEDFHSSDTSISLRVSLKRTSWLRHPAEHKGHSRPVASPNAGCGLPRDEVRNVEQPHAAWPLTAALLGVMLSRTQAKKPKHSSKIDTVRVGVLSLREI
jgi:hypothetical protein